MAVFKSRIIAAERIHSLQDYEEHVIARLRKVVEEQAQGVLTAAHSKVSGGVLHVRKGRLARSLTARTYETPNGPVATVGSNWYIARFYERGFGGKEVSVKPHTRRVSSGNVRAQVTENGKTRKRRVAQGIAFVKAYDRNVPRQQKSFLKSSLDERRSAIRAAMMGAIKP